MTNDENSPGFNRPATSFLQRAVGIDTLLGEMERQIRALSARSEQHFADLFEQVRDSTAVETHRQIAYLDGRLVDLLGEVQRAVTQAHQHQVKEAHQVSLEHRRLQNRAFTRDNLPSALAVKQYYLQLKAASTQLNFDEIGLSVFSQNNEDGILMYIFSRIGMAGQRCIEIGCDLSASTVGIPEGNTVNLISNFAFDGLIVDMDRAKVASIQHFFAENLSTKHLHAPAHKGVPARYISPRVVDREVTPQNINDVFKDAGFTGEIDLLSIDVDGADVRMWEAVEIVSPRVVMIEINARIPFEDVVFGQASQSSAPADTLEYQAARSSSLAAACQVGERKGYEFIGMDATLLNAFFLRRDVWTESFPKRRPSDYTAHRFNPLRYVAGGDKASG